MPPFTDNYLHCTEFILNRPDRNILGCLTPDEGIPDHQLGDIDDFRLTLDLAYGDE